MTSHKQEPASSLSASSRSQQQRPRVSALLLALLLVLQGRCPRSSRPRVMQALQQRQQPRQLCKHLGWLQGLLGTGMM